jgi:hypothetical protein
MLPGAVLRHLERGMIATLPMQLDAEMTGFGGHDDLFEYCTQNPLPCGGRGSWTVPQALQISPQSQNLCTLDAASGSPSLCCCIRDNAGPTSIE